MTDQTTITFVAEETRNLDTVCYRGSAPLAELARISQADIFDQDLNPDGLQRDLSKKHAAEAYDYVAREPDEERPRAFPEVVLNVRDKAVVKVEPINQPAGVPIRLVKLTFDLAAITRARTVKVSRVDGSHRLMFGDGDGNSRAAIELPAPYQLHLGLTREQEANLFLDINATQKSLNTSHLTYLRSKLLPEAEELVQHRHRVFARRLAEDAGSPWHGLVYMGGSRAGAKEAKVVRPVNFAALDNCIGRIFRKSQYIHDLTTPDAQYVVVRSYWNAAAKTWPEAWAEPTEHLLIKGVGLAAMGQLGAVIIDRCMASGETSQRDMERMLAPAKDVFDWSRTATKGGVVGLSGNQAALVVAGELAAKVPKSVEAAFGRKGATA
jgi:DGQHR domain-containing protein